MKFTDGVAKIKSAKLYFHSLYYIIYYNVIMIYQITNYVTIILVMILDYNIYNIENNIQSLIFIRPPKFKITYLLKFQIFFLLEPNNYIINF